MSKKTKKTPFIYKIWSIILIAITVFLIGSIAYLNILNFILLMIVVLIITIISGFSILLMLKSKKKKTGFCISIIIITIFSLISFYINKTTGLLSNLDLDYKTYNYSVVVLESSNYEKLKDINGESIGYYDDGSKESQKALTKILGKVELESNAYDDTHTLANSLLEKEEKAILIEDSYLEILSENITKEGKSFQTQIKKIYSFSIVTKTSDISKDINVTKEPFHIYVSGIDTFGEISSVSRSDVNMVVSINPETNQILLTSIPRDYYVPLHGKSGYRDKLTHAGLYGTNMSIQTIEDLLDIEINYYVKVNFSSVIKIVDSIGGVNVYSDYTFTSRDNFNYKEGYNEVNGEEALSFARERKAFATGDRQRVKNQQALLRAIFDKCTSKSIITKYSKLLDSMNGSFSTNMKMSRLTSLIKFQISENLKWNMVSNSLSGKDSKNYTYSAPSTKAYVMEPDEESIAYAIELIKKIEDGSILNSETMDEVNDYVYKVNKNTTSTSNNENNTNLDNKETTTSSNTETKKEDNFKAKLVKSTFSFNEGDTYIYHGYTATYKGKDIEDKSNITETFKINNKEYDNYQDLVFYVSSLEEGDYKITYILNYQDEEVILTQDIIVESSNISESEKNTDLDTSINDSIIDIETEDSNKNLEE